MKYKRSLVLLLIVFSSTLYSSCQHRTQNNLYSRTDESTAAGFLKDLDKSLQENKVTNLESFLINEQAQVSYKKEWLSHWTKPGLSERFDIVLAGLKRDSQKERAKSLSQALFEPVSPNLKPLEMKFYSPNLYSNSSLNHEFNVRISQFTKKCNEQFPNIFNSQTREDALKTDLMRIVNSYLSSPELSDSWDPADSVKTRRIKQANIYKKLQSSEDLGRVARFSLCRTLSHGDFFPSNQVSEYVDPKALSEAFLVSSLDAANSAGLFFPRIDYLFTHVMREIFPVDKSQPASSESSEAPEKVFYLEPSTIPFHTIFKGIELGECVGGGNAESLTAERWASGVLKGAIVYYVSLSHALETKAKPVGFIQLTPLVSESLGGQSFGVDFGVRELTSTGIYKIDDENFVKGYLFELVLLRLEKEFPNARFFKSNSNAISNSGVSSLLLSSEIYKKSNESYATKDFSHVDPQLAADIVSLGHSNGHANSYRGNVITDATVKDSATLKRLDTKTITSSPLQKGSLSKSHVTWNLNRSKKTLNSEVPVTELISVSEDNCQDAKTLSSNFSTDLQIKTFFSCAQHWLEKPDYYVASRLLRVSHLVQHLYKNQSSSLNNLGAEAGLYHLANSSIGLLGAPKELLAESDPSSIAEVLATISKFQMRPEIRVETSMVIDGFFDRIAPDWRNGKLPAEHSRDVFKLQTFNTLVKKSTSPQITFKKI